MGQPIIGIAGYTDVNKLSKLMLYANAVENAGGCVVLISPASARQDAPAILERLDGLLLPGGHDIHPRFFGEAPDPHLGLTDLAHDEADLALVQGALQRRMPLLGICRGLQVLNVALDGTLYQDLPTQYPDALAHKQTDYQLLYHAMEIVPETQLRRIVGAPQMAVNSHHHQAIRTLGRDVQVTARAPDGVIEAIEIANQPFALAVQYHPEMLFATHAASQHLFAAFLRAAQQG